MEMKSLYYKLVLIAYTQRRRRGMNAYPQTNKICQRQTEMKNIQRDIDIVPTTTPPLPGENQQVQMALPVPAELAAGWLRRATGAGGCDERTSDDITCSVAPWQHEMRPMLLLSALASPSLDGVF